MLKKLPKIKYVIKSIANNLQIQMVTKNLDSKIF